MSATRSRLFKTAWVGLGLSVALLVVWAVCNYRPLPQPGEPAIRVSRETTFLIKPLDKNGDVDYVEAANQLRSEGVTSENNAVVLLLKATGPRLEGERLPAEYWSRLGIDPLPDQGHYYVDPNSWLKNAPDDVRELLAEPALDEMRRQQKQWKEKFGDDDWAMDFDDPGSVESGTDEFGDVVDEFADELVPDGDDLNNLFSRQYDYAMEYPWSNEQFPVMARWLSEMEGPLRKLRRATQRSRYYWPLVVDEGESFIAANLSIVQDSRELARLLAVSAMSHLHAGDVDRAIEDVLAMARLGNQVAEGTTLIEKLVGIAICGIADARMVKLAASGKANSEQLLALRDRLAELPGLGGLADCLNQGERFMGLDALVSIARADDKCSADWAGVSEQSGTVGIFSRMVNWEEAARVLNEGYDRMVRIFEIEDRTKKLQEFQKLEDDFMELQAHLGTVQTRVFTAIGGSGAKGRYVGTTLMMILLPATSQVETAMRRSETVRTMSLVALELAAYKDKHGQFPESLDDLIPTYRSEIPTDTFTGSPLKYVPQNDTFQLYSLGENGVDDGGSMEDFPADIPVEFEIQTWDQYRR